MFVVWDVVMPSCHIHSPTPLWTRRPDKMSTYRRTSPPLTRVCIPFLEDLHSALSALQAKMPPLAHLSRPCSRQKELRQLLSNPAARLLLQRREGLRNQDCRMWVGVYGSLGLPEAGGVFRHKGSTSVTNTRRNSSGSILCDANPRGWEFFD
jgi:hypothetical protein